MRLRNKKSKSFKNNVRRDKPIQTRQTDDESIQQWILENGNDKNCDIVLNWQTEHSKRNWKRSATQYWIY